MRRLLSRLESFAGRFGRCGPFAPVVVLTLLLFLGWTLARMVLALVFQQRVLATADWPWLFVVGWRMDSVLTSYLLMLPLLLLLALPASVVRRSAAGFAAYGALVVAVATYLEIASGPFLHEFDSRPNRIFIDYLRYPAEVLGTVWAEHMDAVAFALAAMAVLGGIAWFAIRGAVRAATPWSWRGSAGSR